MVVLLRRRLALLVRAHWTCEGTAQVSVWLRVFGVLCTIAAMIGVATSNPAAGRRQVFKSNVDGVIIPVSVTSGNHPVSNLMAGDFELRDNGVVQEIQRADSEKVPLDL